VISLNDIIQVSLRNFITGIDYLLNNILLNFFLGKPHGISPLIKDYEEYQEKKGERIKMIFQVLAWLTGF
jgi:hypothetical protein